MSYIVTNSRGQIIANVQDGTVNTTATSVNLVGKNVTPYGEYQIENLVHCLENFANYLAPDNPIEGQLWYNTSAGTLQMYIGTGWKRIAAITASTAEPTLDPKVGDLWWDTTNNQLKAYAQVGEGFAWVSNNRVTRSATQPAAGLAGDLYWNTTNSQLWISDGTNWDLVGPPTVPGFDITRWESTTLLDTDSVGKPVIVGTIDNQTIAIVAAEDFTILASARPTGFASLRKGLNIGTGSYFNGTATTASALAPGATINGVLFNGSSAITIPNDGTLIAGSYLTGGNYNGSANVTLAVDATSANTVSKVVARDSSGNFSAGTITATLSGNATNVTGVVAVANGGTGQTTYANGEILIGDSGSLSKGNITGTSPITVTNSAGGITIGYTGGTGNGSVTSVGILSGGGLSVSGSPITSAGNITITNTGVTSVTAGTNVSVSGATGDITINATGDMTLAGTQTVTGQKTFTGGIISSTYTFAADNTLSYASSPAHAIGVEVNTNTATTFYTNRLLVNGDGQALSGESTGGGAILGIDSSTDGSAGVAGIHTNAEAGLGQGLAGLASNVSYSGTVIQSLASRSPTDSYLHIRCYSANITNPVFQVTGTGNVQADGTYTSPAADYAEYFEWADGNPDSEDRRGLTVALVNNKVKIAEAGDTVIGVVSSTPGIVGDAQELNWVDKYLKDQWGSIIQESYHVYEWTDEQGNARNIASYDITPDMVIPDSAQRFDQDKKGNAFLRPKPNPAFDPSITYVPRSQRKEWTAIGLVGKLRVLKGQVIGANWIKLRDINDQVEEWLIR